MHLQNANMKKFSPFAQSCTASRSGMIVPPYRKTDDFTASCASFPAANANARPSNSNGAAITGVSIIDGAFVMAWFKDTVIILNQLPLSLLYRTLDILH